VVLNMLDVARQIGALPRSGTLGVRVGVWMQHVAAFWVRISANVTAHFGGS